MREVGPDVIILPASAEPVADTESSASNAPDAFDLDQLSMALHGLEREVYLFKHLVELSSSRLYKKSVAIYQNQDVETASLFHVPRCSAVNAQGVMS